MRYMERIWFGVLMLVGAAILFSPLLSARADEPESILGSCAAFSGSIFYARVDSLPTTTDSATMIAFLSTTNGTPGTIDKQFSPGDEGFVVGKHKGFEFTEVQTAPIITVFPNDTINSDFGAAPIPTWAKIQGGATRTPTVGPGTPTATPTPTHIPGSPFPTGVGDRHVIVEYGSTCDLYEMYKSYPRPNGDWDVVSTAHWSMLSNTVRPTLGPTGRPSADASGMPMAPLIPRFKEVLNGAINHAIRVTVAQNKVRCTNNTDECPSNGFQPGYIWPATYSDGAAPTRTPAALPMGAHLRLRSDYTLTCSPACPQTQIFITALKQYGAIIADTDSMQGYADMGLHAEWTADPTPGAVAGWDATDIENLNNIPLSQFEIVQAGTDCTDTYTWCPICQLPC